MIYLKYTDYRGITGEILTDLWDDIHAALFNPDTTIKCLIDFSHVHGKTYQERKADVEQKAIEFSNNAVGDSGDLFFSDMLRIESWFYEQSKRYGLLTDFRENYIC